MRITLSETRETMQESHNKLSVEIVIMINREWPETNENNNNNVILAANIYLAKLIHISNEPWNTNKHTYNIWRVQKGKMPSMSTNPQSASMRVSKQ